MTEADVIAITPVPATVGSLTGDLRALGVAAGDIVIAHSAMSKLGWIAGGAQAVVEALLAAVGSTGTIVMPTQSGQLTDPAAWGNPPVPTHWVEILRADMPAYDPALTPTRGMGQVVECFRSHPATVRSDHPTLSLAANGADRDRIVGRHPLTPGLGDGSPLQTLYDLGAKVLLLGADHGSNTSLHLAEHRATWPGKRSTAAGAPMVLGGERRWMTYEDLELDSEDFVEIGTAFAATGGEVHGAVGAGSARMCSMPAIVDFAVRWMEEHRNHG